MEYFVYVLLSKKDNKFYTGFTSNLNERIKEHNSGKVTSTKYRTPFELVYYEACLNQEDALHREKYLKSTYGKRYIKNRLKKFLNLE
jgi:putative endonuclease